MDELAVVPHLVGRTTTSVQVVRNEAHGLPGVSLVMDDGTEIDFYASAALGKVALAVVRWANGETSQDTIIAPAGGAA